MDHGIQNHEQLSHTRREGYLLFLTMLDQSFVELADDRIELFSS